MPESAPTSTDSPTARLRWRQRPWWMRYLSYGLGCLFLLVAIYGLFDLRGKARWKAHVEDIEKAGGTLDYLALVDHATETPPTEHSLLPWQPRSFYTKPKTLLERIEDQDPEFEFESGDRKNSWSSGKIWWHAARRFSLSPYFPHLTLNRPEAAHRILESMQTPDDEFADLRESLRQGASFYPRFPEGRDEITITVDLSSFYDMANFLSLRALCELETSSPEAALQSILLGFQIARLGSAERLITDQAIQTHAYDRLAQPIWEGLRDHHWSDAQLATLSEAVSASIEKRPTIESILAGERCLAVALFEQQLASFDTRWDVQHHRGLPSPELIIASPTLWDLPGYHFANRLLFASIPTGVLRENLVHRDEINRASLLDASLPWADRLQAEVNAVEKTQAGAVQNPRLFLNEELYGGYLTSILEQFQWLEIIRAAIAAERFFLATGAYPERWSDLVPFWCPTIPEDLWTSGGIRYQRDADNRPLFYSLGANGIDDGGLPSRHFWTEGDLAWRYSLPPESMTAPDDSP